MATLRTPLRPLVRSPLRQPLTYGLQSLFSRYNAGGFLFDRLDPVTRINGLALQYEEDEGATAVDAASDPVGLALDRSQGVGLGPELVTNGGFDSSTGWVTTGEAVIGGGVASVISTVGAAATLRQADVFTTGELYRIEFDAVVNAGSAKFESSGGAIHYVVDQSGAHEFFFLADTTQVAFNRHATPTDVDIDNVSVRKVSGNHAYQGTNASRATLGGGSGNPWYWSFDGSADHLRTGFNPGSSGMVAACFNGDTASRDIVAAYDAASANPISLGLDASGYVTGKVGGVTVAGTVDVRGTDTVALLRWDGSNVYLHVDGTQVDSDTASGSLTSNGLYIGGGNINGTAGNFWDGEAYTAMALAALPSVADALLIQRQLARGVVSL